jgi:uncharacterized glyoxalase superfamily protein PhnB
VKFEPYRIGIIVKNVEQAARWYESNLEFKTYKKMEFPEYDSLKIYFLRQENFEIELVEKKTSFPLKKVMPEYDINKEPLEGFCKIAFRIKDIKLVYEKMKKNGVKEIMPITYDKELKVEFFIVEDNDGNMIQFISR